MNGGIWQAGAWLTEKPVHISCTVLPVIVPRRSLGTLCERLRLQRLLRKLYAEHFGLYYFHLLCIVSSCAFNLRNRSKRQQPPVRRFPAVGAGQLCPPATRATRAIGGSSPPVGCSPTVGAGQLCPGLIGGSRFGTAHTATHENLWARTRL
jgi:hypothetical protein